MNLTNSPISPRTNNSLPAGRTRIYVLHPYCGAGRKGEREENVRRISSICREIVRQGHVPISPIHALGYLDDHVPTDRAVALDLCEDFMQMADEIWAFVRMGGGTSRAGLAVVKSEGCRRDLQYAIRINKPVKYFDYAPLEICETDPTEL